MNIPAEFVLRGQARADRECTSDDFARLTELSLCYLGSKASVTIRLILTGGFRSAGEFARQHGKPCLRLSVEVDDQTAPRLLLDFADKHAVTVLNLAGSVIKEAKRLQFCPGRPDGCF